MKPSLPKGTRDFLPLQVVKRNFIFNTIEEIFKTYGYLPIETPTMENLTTLTGKYGDEGDKLLFKVLNNGDFLSGVDEHALVAKDSNAALSQISKRGLRYDLTVPFARFVVMHQNEINFPFKRYQIQQVWRADRPQKGRYQEFYQCDVDIVGSESLMYEAELVQIYSEVFKKLGVNVKILINNRKILFGLAEAAGIPDQFMDMTIAIDKMEKIGRDGVFNEMLAKDISHGAAEKVLALLNINNITDLKVAFDGFEVGTKGITELETVYDYLGDSIADLVFDIRLARGLSYYTGCIFEVKVDTNIHASISMGSIGGGGRYDNLTGTFGLSGVSGVGVSFGAERIYDVMEELQLFPSEITRSIDLFFIALDEESHKYCFKTVSNLRKNGLACDLYPEAAKMKKQMAYANARQFSHVAIVGEEERKNDAIMLKNMLTGEQELKKISELTQYFSE